jgi:hypothetical protein
MNCQPVQGWREDENDLRQGLGPQQQGLSSILTCVFRHTCWPSKVAVHPSIKRRS